MRKVKSQSLAQQRNSVVWYMFLAPTLIGILLFMAYPFIEVIRLSFYQSNGLIEKFRGLNNYVYILKNEIFHKALFNTFFMAFFQLLISVPIGFLVALAINSIAHGKNFLKALFFIPYVTPSVAAGTLFLFVLHPEGILNMFTGFFGIPAVSWLTGAYSARFGAVALGVWRTLGFNIIIFLAYLQTISPEYYEAAYVDGCNRWQSHLYITFPQMRGAFDFLIIMGWINGLQQFSECFILGGVTGSPARSLHTIVGFIYERGFGNNEFGVAAAASLILFAIIMVLTMINMKLTKGRD